MKNGIDLGNPDSFSDFKNIDVVIHLAAITSVPASFEDPWRFLSANYMATLGALEICRRNKAKMIHISSYLYGPPQYLPIDESHPITPHNPYAQSKLVSEELCYGYHRDFGIPVTILRPFNLYGPGLKDNSLIPTIIRQLPSGEVVVLDPEPKRDYLYVDDLCLAINSAIDADIDGIEVFNLGTGSSVSVETVARMLIRLSGQNIPLIKHNQRRKGEVMDCVADIGKASRILNWSPAWSFEEGLISVLDDWGYNSTVNPNDA
jgi:UDP-glucose 4-epimerase